MSWGPTDLGKAVTRVHVVTADGRSQEFWGDEWVMHFQDNNTTLKLFAKGDGVAAKARRDAALAEELKNDSSHH